jgi:hypothetical protein
MSSSIPFFRAEPQNMDGLGALLTLTGLVVSHIPADLVRRLPGSRAMPSNPRCIETARFTHS